MGRIVSASWGPGASTYTISIPLCIAASCHGAGLQLYRKRIGICLCYQQQAGIQCCHEAGWLEEADWLPALSNT